MEKELLGHIIFEGAKLTLEWFLDDRGKSQAREYFNDLTPDRRGKAFNLFRLLANVGKIQNIEKFRSEGDKIFAFKPMPDRYLCFFYEGGKVIITNAYEKKSPKMPAGEKSKALKAKADYTKRCKSGNYYG